MSKAYQQAGVDINAGYEAVERMSSHVKRTMRKEVLGGLGGFGATFDLSQLNMKAPLLVSGTDGVGTKLKLAIDHNKHDTIGVDAVAMCVNDILTTGAEPLYFLDYIATNKVVPEVIEQIVKGVSDGCEETNTALIGGETAEMGEMYHEGEYDLAGFAVGAVEKDEYIDGSNVKPGQVIIGLESSGIHSNGYSLVRNLIKKSNVDLQEKFDAQRTYLETFLEPTRLYVKPVLAVKEAIQINAMTHITGGGFYENIPRALPEGVTAKVDTTSFPTLPIFDWLQQQGEIETAEMYNVFNMGIGFTIIVEAQDADKALAILKEHDVKAYKIGEIVEGTEPIQLTGV
ncbi:phosphoribosylformylglycinamidine cyclo-ligase [Staphylococcus gallinarum]|jgi:phosphoribosylformylglycinamidine cyclo-ligase|uniref:Phosphoribosylformylglycinamidine cyclo-ligase n=1 Tax=Staphylococcus gallinarum TaxID=1293 RepID=A0A2T4SZR4_STAGA|nr:phosphoribosylformylglycinamidine cyclo-ligase [Staphylococcus gallinarum]MBU7217799.1 phosphoribosylformylglycinamidine cyclo-ligase [Staphylococcus gallinarum]MCD8793298.1 phosphoribosylformylglycinamidine cyclo-ligase [Staphylococcus gallinarum]MCD8843380.1 phosphoribosylformylglycinamidine cyclo-ligase [Staphylococcus gallinarum]MCD8917905.1 phosphoribosylformylglycinamidine cyclo-ligase [Staphylococcus gallinarum]MEB6242213.1 phosphoribosylformylglycinamidine cyclo-ligase [Staphylococc